MTAKQIENLALLLITFLLAFAVYVILYHPEWLTLLFTIRR